MISGDVPEDEAMTRISERLRRRLSADYPSVDAYARAVEIVESASSSERIQAAVVLWGAGDLRRLTDAASLARDDWRDVLVRANLADDDWPERIEAEFGTSRVGNVRCVVRNRARVVWDAQAGPH
jgi:hypothetical protein